MKTKFQPKKTTMKTKMKFYALFMVAIFIASMIISGCNKDDDTVVDTPDDNLPEISGYPIVGTNQTTFFNDLTTISAVSEGDDYYGQNANYPGNTPQYVDNGDGTLTDMVTGLMWQSSFDHNGDGTIDYSDKLGYDEIVALT